MKTQIQTGLINRYTDKTYGTFRLDYRNGRMACPDLLSNNTLPCTISQHDILEAVRERRLRIKTSSILKFLDSNKSLFFCVFRLIAYR